MEWKDVLLSTRNVLEMCLGIYNDQPRTFTTTIGEEVSGELVTEQTYTEILSYREGFPHFEVKRNGEKITVFGTCEFGDWLKSKKEVNE